MNSAKVVRILITGFLIYKSFYETGIFTALLFVILFLTTECEQFLIKELRELSMGGKRR